VKGIGGTFAGRLAAHGISDIEELGAAMPEDLSGVKGLSKKRAEQWIDEAMAMVKFRHGRSLRDSGRTVRFASRSWPHGIDPYRLRRSLDLTIQCVARDHFRVTGGLEPHEVNRQADSWTCDCIDCLRGNLCKHILAVQRHCRDKTVNRLVKSLKNDARSDQLDLLELWLNCGKPVRSQSP
jgi:helicase